MPPRRTTCDTRYAGISLTEFADGVEPHAAFCAGQVFPLSESHEGVLHGGEGRARSFQFHVDGMNALCDVQLQGFQKQRPLVAEGVIHALPADAHDAHQFISGRGGKALLGKKAYRLPNSLLHVELLRSSHAPRLFLSLSFQLSDVSPVDGKAGSGDEGRFFRREVRDEAGDLRYITHSLQRNELNQFHMSGSHVGGCGSGLNVVDRNGARGEIDRSTANQSGERSLGHAVNTCAGEGSADGGIATDEDDPAAVFHYLSRCLNTNEGGTNVD